MRASAPLLTAVLLYACAPSSPPAADGGESPETDAGTPDAGAVTDAGGAPSGLGPELLPNGDVRFTVASSRATRLVVQLFAKPTGADEALTRELSREPGTDRWSVVVTAAQLAAAQLGLPLHYGLRAWGPNWPYDAAWTKGGPAGFVADVDAQGNRFNPNKLLLDPWAREVSHDPATPSFSDESVYESGPANRLKDSGKVAPKGIVFAAADVPVAQGRPTRPLREDVIYEVHLRGFTRSDPSVEEACRGTYKAAGQKAAYLKALGVTAVELLPLQETRNDTNDFPDNTANDNYWGYSTLSFFAPDRHYACDRSPGGPTRELKQMVKAFHDAGLKVFVDVVYNHTGEGGTDGTGNYAALRSWRGLDNAAYYQVLPDGRRYRSDNGVGPNLNVLSDASRALILDSLKYWSRDLGVDGFRFDLAAVLGNACAGDCFRFDGAKPDGVLQRTVRELPARPEGGGAGVDLIAEPWGVTQGTYALGKFPAGWGEWNGEFRDAVRRDQNKLNVEAVTPRTLARRLTGSTDLFGARPSNAAVNYLVSHDGFTLKDLYSCNEKRNNQPWPYGPSDGGEDNNLSWDHGGAAGAQRQAARTGMTLLVLSTGAAMFTGGDEMLRTQFCNNNPYNLDSDKNWLDWGLAEANAEFLTFTRRLLAFRAAHPALRPARFRLADGNGNGVNDVAFFTAAGTEASGGYLDDANNHFLGVRYDGTELGDPSPALYLAYNGGETSVDIKLPAPFAGKTWHRVLDTGSWMEPRANIVVPGAEETLPGMVYGVNPRSAVMFLQR